MPRGIRKNGRPALTRQAFARLTEAQHVAYLRLGGADWLRAQIERAAPRLAATPCANNPFPAFTVTRADGTPLDYTITTREY